MHCKTSSFLDVSLTFYVLFCHLPGLILSAEQINNALLDIETH